MKRRLPIVLGMLACGVVAVVALSFVMESRLAAVPKVIAWLGLFVAGAACLLLFIIGIMRNTREELARRKQRGASVPQPSFFPMAPDPSLARDAAELLRVPPDARDAAWEMRFYGTVAAAALVPADPPQFTGPDGMPYAAFRLADDGAPPQLSLTTAAETLTDRGIGAVLNPKPDKSADWVFTTGDMVSLRLLGRIVPAPRDGQQPPDPAIEREVLCGSPSEALLPSYTREAIRTFMQGTLGIPKPAVFLISDVALQPPESLVFNISGQQLAADWTEQAALRYLGWFLPQHYRAISVPADSSLARHFQPL